ncbi:MAG: hypothetical protein AAGC67_07145 [Myxococcota bacterium]
MSSTAYAYESTERAREVAQALKAQGFDPATITVVGPQEGRSPSDVIADAKRSDGLPSDQATFAQRAVEQGRGVVSIRPAFGKARVALATLESFGPVAVAEMRADSTDDPSPLSDLLGWPTLSDSSVDASDMAYWSNYTVFGEPRMLKNGAPFSSIFRMPLLTRSAGPKKSKIGFPLLMNNPAPFSSLFRMPLLSKSQRAGERSFGLPLLSRNATPASSMLGMRVLSKNKPSDGSKD